jgi:cytochrome c551/c552
MGTLDALIPPPAIHQLPVLGGLAAFLLLFFLPYTGMLLASTAASLLAGRGGDAWLGGHLARLTGRTWAPPLVFGALPYLALAFLMGQVFHGEGFPVARMLFLLSPPFLLAFGLLLAYRRGLDPRLGGAGVALLFLALAGLTAVLDLGFFPEHWRVVETPLPHLFSVSVVVHLAAFLLLSVLLTGGAVLYFYFRWSERKLEGEERKLVVLRNLGAGMALGGGLLLPPVLVWDLYTLPFQALSPRGFVLAAAMVLLLMVASALAFTMLRNAHARFAAGVFGTGIVLFGLQAYRVVDLQAAANREHAVLAAMESAALRAEEVARREDLLAASIVADAVLGERIYNERCTACHQFDRKVVGPPYNQVLPKYKDRIGDLEAFIRKPVKVDPAYPAMPALGLSLGEVKSVARFLMEHEEAPR